MSIKISHYGNTYKRSEEAAVVKGLDVVAEKESTKEENDWHEEDIVIENEALSLALITDVDSKPASGAVSLGILPVGTKVSGIGEVLSLQASQWGKLVAVTHPGHGGINEPLIIGVVPVDDPEADERLVDEYESNNSGEYLLGETGEQLHHSTRVERYQANHEECGPHSNPEPEIEEWNIVRGAEVEDNLFKDDCWSCSPEDNQGLPREYTEDQITNPNSQNHLCGTLKKRNTFV